MNCPKCNSPMEIKSQIRWIEKGRDKTRSSTVYYCINCNYYLEPINYQM